jgi:CheY-like chemotaxis protein
MPIMGGYEACRNIQLFFDNEQKLFRASSTRLRRPILVALSAFVNREIYKKCIDEGFDIVI